MNVENEPHQIDQAAEQKYIKQYLQEIVDIEEKDVEKIELIKAKNLPKNYQAQLEALHDERLGEIDIAIVPDNLWAKGNQPSESNAEKKLILLKQSYFTQEKNPDEIAWLCHELAHCQKFLDSDSAEEYQKRMREFAFPDLKTEFSYPNNPVEEFAFTKQFQFLKNQGKTREDIFIMLKEYYGEEDSPFFEKLLDNIYKK